MPIASPRYADDLLTARSNETRCCFICDGAQAGATVLYRDGRWLVVKHFDRDVVATADQLALVTLDELADPEKLTALALATDFEDEPLWLIDARKLRDLKPYGAALKVLWRSDKA